MFMIYQCANLTQQPVIECAEGQDLGVPVVEDQTGAGWQLRGREAFCAGAGCFSIY